jgi:hypothetical protein
VQVIEIEKKKPGETFVQQYPGYDQAAYDQQYYNQYYAQYYYQQPNPQQHEEPSDGKQQ